VSIPRYLTICSTSSGDASPFASRFLAAVASFRRSLSRISSQSIRPAAPAAASLVGSGDLVFFRAPRNVIIFLSELPTRKKPRAPDCRAPSSTPKASVQRSTP